MPKNFSNSFDALRLLLALAVLYSHSYLITGLGDSPIFAATRMQMSVASIAVLGFFGLSGMLIAASYERSDGFFHFFKKRIVRIMPAFWVCLLVTAFVFAPLIAYTHEKDLSNFPFVGQQSALSYVRANFFLRIQQWSIGNVLGNATYTESINGSLWSLYPEFQCYVTTFFLGYLGLLKQNRVLLLLLFVYCYILYVLALFNAETARNMGPMIFMLNSHRAVYLAYGTGMLVRAFPEYAPLNKSASIFLVILCAVTLKNGGFLLLAPVAVPLLVLAAGSSFTLSLKHDFSYGIYIYGFVVQQFLSSFDCLKNSFILFLGSSIMLSIALGAASWFLIERPLLTRFRST